MLSFILTVAGDRDEGELARSLKLSVAPAIFRVCLPRLRISPSANQIRKAMTKRERRKKAIFSGICQAIIMEVWCLFEGICFTSEYNTFKKLAVLSCVQAMHFSSAPTCFSTCQRYHWYHRISCKHVSLHSFHALSQQRPVHTYQHSQSR
jgi:hypothetical protein